MIGGLWQSAWLFVFAAAGTAKDPKHNPGTGKRMYILCLHAHELTRII
jgi:MFS transporter, SP family, sugar:H+ symporter